MHRGSAGVNQGQLYYTDDVGNVIVLDTADAGKTWT